MPTNVGGTIALTILGSHAQAVRRIKFYLASVIHDVEKAWQPLMGRGRSAAD
ncbi:hypothetical protein [Methylobacterium sp. WSM2598]|uniref:hypothetical protein n=1 Tax=Methylobacterium sp. WSM2598 TaxID=398261 RepID=UPI00039A9598|nr:hypothetical protein [Methylobacterium sp. WSM2598]